MDWMTEERVNMVQGYLPYNHPPFSERLGLLRSFATNCTVGQTARYLEGIAMGLLRVYGVLESHQGTIIPSILPRTGHTTRS